MKKYLLLGYMLPFWSDMSRGKLRASSPLFSSAESAAQRTEVVKLRAFTFFLENENEFH